MQTRTTSQKLLLYSHLYHRHAPSLVNFMYITHCTCAQLCLDREKKSCLSRRFVPLCLAGRRPLPAPNGRGTESERGRRRGNMLVVTFTVANTHARLRTQCGIFEQEGEADMKLNTKCALCRSVCCSEKLCIPTPHGRTVLLQLCLAVPSKVADLGSKRANNYFCIHVPVCCLQAVPMMSKESERVPRIT